MNKVELNKYIESICTQIPLVNSFYTQDVYEIWNTEEVKYGSVSFYVQSSSVGENSTTWTGLIYYADRLLENKGNLDQIHTDAVNVITSVMNTIYSDEDIVSINFPTNVELFEQSFVDWLAGGYATIQIETDNSINGCGFGYIKDEGGCEGAINELNKEIEELEDVIDGKNEIIASKDEEIEDLNTTIEELKKGGIDFSSIGYDKTESLNANERFNNDMKRSQELLEHWRMTSNGVYNTNGFKDIVYAPYYEFTPRSGGDVSIYNLFSDCTSLIYIPLYDTSLVKDMRRVFINCSALTTIPLLDTSNVTNMAEMFVNCTSLTTIPQLDTSKVTSMYYMFSSCSSLTTIPLLDTSNVTNMSYMFDNCTSLTTIPLLDTSKVTFIERMFYGCSSLTTIPLLDISNVTNVSYMFSNCSSLTTIPLLDTSNVTNMSYMFSNCTSLTTIPQLDTSKATNMNYMVGGCGRLESLPLLNCSSVTSFSTFFGYGGNITTLTYLGGFTGLKINWTGTGSLKNLPNLTVQSLLNVFNTIADVTDLGGRKLEIGTTNLAKLTDEQKQIAINKGWTLS